MSWGNGSGERVASDTRPCKDLWTNYWHARFLWWTSVSKLFSACLLLSIPHSSCKKVACLYSKPFLVFGLLSFVIHNWSWLQIALTLVDMKHTLTGLVWYSAQCETSTQYLWAEGARRGRTGGGRTPPPQKWATLASSTWASRLRHVATGASFSHCIVVSYSSLVGLAI